MIKLLWIKHFLEGWLKSIKPQQLVTCIHRSGIIISLLYQNRFCTAKTCNFQLLADEPQVQISRIKTNYLEPSYFSDNVNLSALLKFLKSCDIAFISVKLQNRDIIYIPQDLGDF